MQVNAVQEREPGLQGIKEYEPRVVHQLLDFMYRNVAEVLQVAEVSLCRYSTSYQPQTACRSASASGQPEEKSRHMLMLTFSIAGWQAAYYSIRFVC